MIKQDINKGLIVATRMLNCDEDNQKKYLERRWY